MAGRGAGRFGFGAGAGGGLNPYRNAVTGGVGPSSLTMGTNIPGAPAPQVPAAPQPAVQAAKARKAAADAAAAKANKPALTGFVITCRLKPNAKLIPPDARDTVQNSTAPERTAIAAPVHVIHGATDNSDDSGDTE